MGARSRRKGAAWEREVAAILREAMPGCDAKRGLGQARCAHEVADVDVPGFWIECKRGKRISLTAALRQATEAREAAGATKTAYALVVAKEDRTEPAIAMQLSDFLELLREWWERGRR
jgi:hypothetical protein